MISFVLMLALVAGAPTSADAEARSLYADARVAYDAGLFDEALAGFQAAYTRAPLPGFLFNLGQCERQLGRHDRAIFFFERYLEERPDAANRPLVEELLAESRSYLAAAAATSTSDTTRATAAPVPTAIADTPTTSPEPMAPSPDDGSLLWAGVGIGVATVAVVAVGTGIGLWLGAPTLGVHTVGR